MFKMATEIQLLLKNNLCDVSLNLYNSRYGSHCLEVNRYNLNIGIFVLSFMPVRNNREKNIQ